MMVGGQLHVPATSPLGKTHRTIVHEAWWASGLVWKDIEQRKFLAHPGV